MNEDILKSKVKNAFITVLGHNNFTLNDTTTAHDVEGWESITHMMIITEIETTLSIRFKLMDLMQMDTVGDLFKAINKELSATT